MFDNMILLSANPGQAIYNGPMGDAMQYWKDQGFLLPEAINPTDFFLDSISPLDPAERKANVTCLQGKEMLLYLSVLE